MDHELEDRLYLFSAREGAKIASSRPGKLEAGKVPPLPPGFNSPGATIVWLCYLPGWEKERRHITIAGCDHKTTARTFLVELGSGPGKGPRLNNTHSLELNRVK